VLDEGNRMSEKSWASLAGPVSTNRRMAESIVAGVTHQGAQGFQDRGDHERRFLDLRNPDYIMSRLATRH